MCVYRVVPYPKFVIAVVVVTHSPPGPCITDPFSTVEIVLLNKKRIKCLIFFTFDRQISISFIYRNAIAIIYFVTY